MTNLEKPSEDRQTVRRIAVIGGGIAGLAAAYRIAELGTNVGLVLFEATDRLGGVLSTRSDGGFQVERSADNFITTSPWGLELCRRLGLADQLLQTDPRYRRTFVVRRGRLFRLPDGFLMMAPTKLWPLAITPLLSTWGKLRAACEYFIPPKRDDSDESMANFVRRRLGKEVFERLVEPLVSAVYAADMERLSVLATLPRFRDMEREYGSLIRAMRAARRKATQPAEESGARYSLFVTLRHGLSSFADAIGARLPLGSIRLSTPVNQLIRQPSAAGWQVITQSAAPGFDAPRSADDRLSAAGGGEVFDAVILATPSTEAARLIEPFDPVLASELAQIAHSGTAVVSLGFDESHLGHPIDGMGAVIPAVENSSVLAVSFSSRKYAHRAPPGKVLLRAFLGGARQPELAEADESYLVMLATKELRSLLQISGAPCFVDVARWPRTMPQYFVGHRQRVQRIEECVQRHHGLYLAGNAYRGVGLPDCIRSGEAAAEAALKALG